MEIIIKEIKHGSPEYNDEVSLRMEILRKPLNLTFDPQQLKAENTDYHIGAYLEDRLVGCLVLTPSGEDTLRMRQVAIANDCQRKGVGRSIVAYSEKLAKEKRYKQIVLHARQTAVPFYIALDYTPQGSPFEEIGIPHQLMRKILL